MPLTDWIPDGVLSTITHTVAAPTVTMFVTETAVITSQLPFGKPVTNIPGQLVCLPENMHIDWYGISVLGLAGTIAVVGGVITVNRYVYRLVEDDSNVPVEATLLGQCLQMDEQDNWLADGKYKAEKHQGRQNDKPPDLERRYPTRHRSTPVKLGSWVQ